MIILNPPYNVRIAQEKKLSELISKQQIYNILDSEPKILCAKEHRPAYGTDGDYFSKPSKDL